ncbi:hypothetical protein ebA1053 [Aromatoleum aromaticum EbN1]|uniref:Uncharacterized protein n=1 Tax=Aromatoleum aromaticum (strain DSM 19018 / LMG 30748 / EbN1) TaxID=76114 RepID=Q5P7N3_AROAE|nr:hypothetical protein ebA1053 [Aromatoleum aromaticum EbN1]
MRMMTTAMTTAVPIEMATGIAGSNPVARDAAEHFAHQHDQLQRPLVADTVIDAIRILSGLQHPLVPEDRQVLGDVALRGADRLHDFLDADFALAEDAQDLEPQRVCNRLEGTSGSLDVFVLVDQVDDGVVVHCGGEVQIRRLV